MNSKIFLVLGLILGVLLVACSNESNSEDGRLIVKITDAPFPHEMVSEANITISKIEIRNKSNDAESSFLTVSEEERTINVLTLTNGLTETLVDINVPAGTFDLVRLYIKTADIKLVDGRVFDLKVPSGAQTGLKVFVKPSIQVVGGLTEELLLDVDVSKSFIAKGNTNSASGITGFNFKPVLKAANISTTGSLTGIVTDTVNNVLEGVRIGVYAADTLNTTTFTDSLGKYTVLGLSAGSYNVEAALQGYLDQEIQDIEILAANLTEQNFELIPKLVD